MFALAISLGVFSYILFFLGVSGLFYKSILIPVTSAFVVVELFYFRKQITNFLKNCRNVSLTKIIVLSFFLIALQAVVNIIGVLGPEISFDALWYHLTLAKLYVTYHRIFFIPGGILYYSAMPKVAEQLFSATLAFGWETFPKVLHFLFGIGCCVLLFKLARKFVNIQLALLCVLVFYSNLVIGWESITGYIDLVRVFFEGASLYAFIIWIDSKNKRWLFISALLVGFALTTKLLALSSVGIFALLIFFISKQKLQTKKNILDSILYFIIAFSIPLPWFIFSYLNTGNPFYPFFSLYFTHLQNTTLTLSLFNPFHIMTTFWTFFLKSSDPISPIYIAAIPLIVIYRKQFSLKENVLLWYTILGLTLWYFISGVEGTRIALPYIFSFSVLVGIVLQKIAKAKIIYYALLLFIFVISLVSIGYRSIANAKFIPVILSHETKAAFLAKYLNFSFGDWYDVDGYMQSHIKPTDTVLLYGYHNLYYVDFSYIHYSWVKKGDKFNYVATDGGQIPTRFSNWKLVYQNKITHIHLYSDGGKVWTY